MSEPDRMTLAADTAQAFKNLADYLGSVRMDPSRRRIIDGETYFAQTHDWCQGALELSGLAEARARELHAVPAPPPARIVGFQNVLLPLPEGPHGPGGPPIQCLIAFASDGSCFAVTAAEGGCTYVRLPDLPRLTPAT